MKHYIIRVEVESHDTETDLYESIDLLHRVNED